MKLNKKGFTMVEIIATVTILGILSVIGIVSVNSIIQRGKQEHYNSAEKSLRMSAESYAQANRSYLPKNVGEMTKVTLKTLVEDNYIEEIQDYYDQKCDLEKSYVQIFKYSKTDYSYLTYLNCPDYSNEEELNDLKPNISISMTEDSDNVKKTKTTVKFTDTNKLLSYTITIYKYDEEVYTTGNMEANYETSITKTIDISKYTPGTIKVVAQATNIYGQTETKTMTNTYKDRQAPECIIAEADKNPKTWLSGDRKITVGCNDGEEGSGCARETFTKTFKKDAKTDKIIIKDKAGNETECTVTVYIDKTKPNSCAVTTSGTKGTNSWYVSNATVTLTSADALSGIAKTSLQSTSGLTEYNGKTSGTQTDTKGIVWYGYVEDYAGNRTNCVSNSFKVDTTPPAAPTGGSIAVSGSSTTATLGAVTGGDDATSGFKEFRYQVINNNSTYPANSSDKFKTSRTFTRSCGTTYYAYAIAVDNAGNKSAVYKIGTAADGKDEYSAYGACTKACGGGTQTRTNSCALVTTGFTRACNEQACCSKVNYKDGTSCTKTCGGGTYNRLAYSAYDGSRCSSKDESSGGSACNTQACCSSVTYKDGTSCTKSCGSGTYNRLAYSAYDGSRCSSKDESSGGSACNTQGCCSKVTYKDGSSCTKSCGGGTYNRLAYSAYDGSRCSGSDTSSGGSACNTQDCCSKVNYVDGSTCSASCGDGTYNRFAYSAYNSERCPSYDQNSGGSYCNLGSCEEDIYEIRYYECDSYYITTCTSTTCKYTEKNGSTSSGTLTRSLLSTEKPASCTPVAKAQCYAFLYAKNGSTVTFTTSDDDACAIKSVSGGSCTISGQKAHSFRATYAGAGASCSFYVSIEGVYKYQGKEYNSISWTTRMTSTGFCTDSCCI